MTEICLRPLGATGLMVSQIGFGAWGIGGRTAGTTSYGAADDAVSLAALTRAAACGVRLVDVAPAYGDGHAEDLVGRALGDRPDVVVATKVGFVQFDQPARFEPDDIRRSIDASRARLRRDRLDLVQLHSPPTALLLERPEIVGTLEALARDGVIRSWGASVKAPADALALAEKFDLPMVQVNLNMMDWRAMDSGLLDLAQRRQIGVIARTPLNFGFLAGGLTRETTFPPGDHRNGWPRGQIERWIDGAQALIAAAGATPGAAAVQAALRFCLSFPGVSAVIPGVLTPAEAEQNAAAGAAGPLSGAVLAALRAVYDQFDGFPPVKA